MKDYRVSMEIRFDLDVPAESELDACRVAKHISSEVMRESFSRAECVQVAGQYAQQILQERTPR